MQHRIIPSDETCPTVQAHDLALAKRLRVLAASPLFERVDRSELTRLAERTRSRRFSRGQSMAQHQGQGRGLQLIVSGTAKLTMACPLGRAELLLEVLRPGDWFGECEMFAGDGTPPVAVALTDCEVVIVPSPELQILVARHAELALGLIEMMCQRLQTVRQLAASAAFLDIGGRLYRRLLEICRVETGQLVPGQRLAHGLSQREMASSVGASRESLNKVLAAWQRDGHVSVERGVLVVLKPLALAKAAACAGAFVAFTKPVPAAALPTVPSSFTAGAASPCVP